MAVIDEKTAWDILNAYAQDCADIGGDSLIAVYAIGSLPGGYYRPGISDIDAVLIVSDGSEETWGNCDTSSEQLDSLNTGYKSHYEIPKDFGPFPVTVSELYPPYDPEKELTMEIARLKVQGKCMYGDYPLDTIPMPEKVDFLNDFRNFENFWDNDFSKNTDVDQLTAEVYVNTALIHLNRYLITDKGIIQFNKDRTTELHEEYNSPFADKQVFALVRKHWNGGCISGEEYERLRDYTLELRVRMNKFLGIRQA
ncbi:MAG: hypothetical protein JW712_13845 [Dehalococcoidales bacterium]|nr:hypothetical protein [Dehalococcoidales bacterium]